MVLLLAACEVAPPCAPLVHAPYTLALVARHPDGFFCFSQDNPVDLTDDSTLAASFVEGCKVVLTEVCSETTLETTCTLVALECHFDGALGECTTDLGGGLVCEYDAWLVREAQ